MTKRYTKLLTAIGNEQIELIIGLSISIIFATLIWTTVKSIPEQKIKLRTYMDCSIAPELKLYAVPSRQEIYGVYYFTARSTQCSELTLVSTRPIIVKNSQAGNGVGTQYSKRSHAKDDVFHYQWRIPEYPKTITFALSQAFTNGNRIKLILDFGDSNFRADVWDKDLAQSVLRAHNRERTTIRFAVAEKYDQILYRQRA